MSEMANLHFVSVIEALLECRSPSLNKLLPIWRPILNEDNTQVRIYSCLKREYKNFNFR